MASAITFDTHAYVKKLRAAGVPEKQAEVQVEAITALIEDRVATKQDLEILKTDLKRDLKELETKLERDMKELEMRLLIRLGVLGVVGIGIIAALVKLL